MDLLKKYVDMINLALEAKPDDMVITMHICRGNFRSTWFTSGGYEPVAKILFGKTPRPMNIRKRIVIQQRTVYMPG